MREITEDLASRMMDQGKTVYMIEDIRKDGSGDSFRRFFLDLGDALCIAEDEWGYLSEQEKIARRISVSIAVQGHEGTIEEAKGLCDWCWLNSSEIDPKEAVEEMENGRTVYAVTDRMNVGSNDPEGSFRFFMYKPEAETYAFCKWSEIKDKTARNVSLYECVPVEIGSSTFPHPKKLLRSWSIDSPFGM